MLGCTTCQSNNANLCSHGLSILLPILPTHTAAAALTQIAPTEIYDLDPPEDDEDRDDGEGEDDIPF